MSGEANSLSREAGEGRVRVIGPARSVEVERGDPITLTLAASRLDPGSSPGQALSRIAGEVLKHRRVRACLVPLVLLALWWLGTRSNPDGLIPPPAAVGVALWDLAFGGINDDAFSQMLLTDLIASASRVYGAFLLAAAVALPLGMLIGRLRVVRELLEPTFQLLRPVPVTAWLPLSMIIFGLGPRSAFFLVALGAFYPILVNTVFAVRSVEPRLFEAAQMLGVSPGAPVPQGGAARFACPACSPACGSASASPGW